LGEPLLNLGKEKETMSTNAKTNVTKNLLSAMAAANVPLEDALWFNTKARVKGVVAVGDVNRARSIFARIVDSTCLA
jgi:hypothetical protein